MVPPFPFSPTASVSAPKPSSFGLALVRVAGDDSALRAVLHARAWVAYREAGFPEGPDEDGLDRWWSARIDGMRN